MATVHEQNSLVPLPEIPVKLRCTICSELARGAVRLPCCEQAICEECRSNLPNVCPVCDHSPLSGNDCKPNSALRTTVAVFLRTAEKKHMLLLQKELKEKPKQVESKNAVKPLEPESEISALKAPSDPKPLTPPREQEEAMRDPVKEAPNSEQDNPVQVSKEIQGQAKDSEPAPEAQQTNGFSNSTQGAWMNNPGAMAHMANMQQMVPGQNFSGPNGWNDYTQILHGMQGWPAEYGNMMGYPGMNPMAVAQGGGFNGGNFDNMGGGGAGGFNGGQDGNGAGWNGVWNGQNNMGFNPGMDGTRNGGYYSAASAGGYNHQSHGNHQMPAQQFQNHHFQRQQPYPPRGGRGGFAVGPRPFVHDRQQFYQGGTISQQLQEVDELVAATEASGDVQGEKIPSVVSGEPDNIADSNDMPIDSTSTVVAGATNAAVATTTTAAATTMDPANHSSTAPVNPDMAQYFSPDDFRGPILQQPPFQAPRGGFRRGGFQGNFGNGARGGGYFSVDATQPFNGVQAVEPRPVPGVEGAPTGPKALREKVAGRGILGRGGFIPRGRGGFVGSSWSRSMSPNRENGKVYSRSASKDSRRRSRSSDRNRSRDRSKDHSRDRSKGRRRRSRSRDRSRTRHRRRRSPSADSNNEEHRGRTPKRDGEEEVPKPEDKEPGAEDTGDQNIPKSASSITGRVKRTRDPSGSRSRTKSVSKSRSRSGERRHKRTKRHRRRSPTPERERSNRHHKRSHKHKSKRHHRSRSRSRSRSPRDRSPRDLKKEDYSDDEKATHRGAAADEGEGGDKRSRRDSRDRDRKHRRRSKRRDESRHRSHRHSKSTRHDRHDKHDRKDRHERNDANVIEKSPKRFEEPQQLEMADAVPEQRKARKESRSERKMSYKYENEGDLERQAERDREAERWGIK